MSKKIVKSLSLAAAVSATGLVVANAQAEEVATPTTESTAAGKTTVTAEELATQADVVSDAKAEMDSASAEEVSAQTTYSEAQNTLVNDQSAYDETTNEISTREDNIPVLKQNVQDAETAASHAQAEEVASSEAVSSANKEVETETAKIQPQVDDLNAKSETLSEKEVVQEAAQTTATQAAKELSDTKSNISTAESDLTKLEATLHDKANALEAAKAADQARTENIAAAQVNVDRIAAENQELMDSIAKAKSDVATYEGDVTRAQDAIMKNFDLTFSDEFISAVKAYSADETPANNERLKAAGDAWLQAINVKGTKEQLRDSDTRPVDWSKLTQDQLSELTVFAAQLIEDFRTQMGTYGEDQLQVTVETNRLAELIAGVYKNKIKTTAENEVPTIWDAISVGHIPSNETMTTDNLVTSGVMQSADGRKPSTARDEVLSFESVAGAKYLGLDKTMGGMKALVYGAVVGMIADDSGAGWGHTMILAHNVEGFHYQNDRTQLELLFVRDGDYLIVGMDETKFDYSPYTGLNTENVSLTPIEVPKTDSTQAKRALTEAQASLKESTTRLATLQGELAKVAPEYKAAQDTLTKAQAVPIQTPSAQAAYDTAQQAVQAKQQEVNDLKAQLPVLEQAVKDANQKLTQANADLKDAQDAYNLSKANYDKVSQDLEAAKVKAALLQKAYEDAIAKSDEAEQDLLEAKQAVIDNDNEIVRLKALLPAMIDKIVEDKEALEVAKVRVVETKAIYEAAKADYLKEKAIYDAMVLADLQAKHDQLVADGKTPVPVYEDGVLVDYVAEVPKSPSTLNHQEPTTLIAKYVQAAFNQMITHEETIKAVARRQSQNTYEPLLPNTGDDSTATFTLMGMSLLALGAVGTRKRRVD